MRHRTDRRRIMLFLTGLLAAAGAGAAQAQSQMQIADPLFVAVRYHEAARAAELCAGKKFTHAENDKIAGLVGQETAHRLTIGEELTAIRESRNNMDLRVKAEGCKSPLVVDALKFFESYRDRIR